MFGAGDHLADVTPRVIELLGRKPSGFTANAQSLGAEPWPGKKKHLTIRYEYQGADCVLTVPGQKKLTYQALVQHACRQEPATSP